MNNYDLIIVGAGPAGLALAQCMRKTYKKILIVDRENVIGGCHRVRRVPINNEKIFTEHGPRIYSNTYKNFQTLLLDMNSDFFKLFTPYNFSISEIGGQTVFSTLSFGELFKLSLQFFMLIFNKNHGMDISIGDFMSQNNFSEKSIDMINRICRLTDGAGADRYTLNEFLELFNQQFFYKLYQPSKPNDIGLFKVWGDFLTNNGIEIMLDTSVKKINLDDKNLLKSITVLKNDNDIEINGAKIVLATPPESFLPILENSVDLVQNTFKNFEDLKEYADNTSYIDYISLTFHWNKKLKLPKVYGFPKSEWGVVFIILTNYMKFEENISQTVISCAITIPDVIVKSLGKNANQCTKDEIFREVLKQLREAYPDLEEPTLSLLSPGVYYDENQKKWISKDEAFVTSSKEGFLPFSGRIKNLYNLGTHNGYQNYKFTSLESAVTNSIKLSHVLDKKLKNKYQIQDLFTFAKFFKIVVLVLILLIIMIYIFRRKNKNKNK